MTSESASYVPLSARTAVPLEHLLRALNSAGPSVVLRNHDIAANLERGGDVDLLVANTRQTERQLVTELGDPFSIARRSYVTSLFYPWGHLDLLPALEWRGARYIDEKDVLQASVPSPAGVPKPRLAHEALVSWFSSLVWGGFFKSRYRDVILDAASHDGRELQGVLRHALGNAWGDRLWDAAAQGRPEDSQLWVSQLRRTLWRRALMRAPIQTLSGATRFVVAELLLCLRPPLPWIAILGPDGSGKSTLLQGLSDAWPRSFGAIHRYHLRPHRLDRPGASAEPVIDPHAQPPRGAAASTLAILFVVADWWIGYWTQIVRRRAKQGLVVFDRHFLDMLVDPRRYRYGGPQRLLRAASRVVPKPDIVVVLDAPPAVIRSRKQEVSTEESIRQSAAYRQLAEEIAGGQLVDACRDPHRVVADVLSLLVEEMRASIPKRSMPEEPNHG